MSLSLLLLFLHNFFMLFTDMSVALFEDFAVFPGSSVVNESAENRLVVPERARPWTCGGGSTSSITVPRGTGSRPMLTNSHWFADSREPPAISGVEGYLPKGSGDRGMTGDDVEESALRADCGGYKDCSSSSSRLRNSDSAEG